jgi:hypothetical protein
MRIVSVLQSPLPSPFFHFTNPIPFIFTITSVDYTHNTLISNCVHRQIQSFSIYKNYLVIISSPFISNIHPHCNNDINKVLHIIVLLTFSINCFVGGVMV